MKFVLCAFAGIVVAGYSFVEKSTGADFRTQLDTAQAERRELTTFRGTAERRQIVVPPGAIAALAKELQRDAQRAAAAP